MRSVTIGRNMALRRCRRNMNIALGAMRVSAPENALPGAHPRHAGLAGVELVHGDDHGELSLFDKLFDVQVPRARGDVPINETDLVAGHVGPHVGADLAVFGQKDAQQCAVIRRSPLARPART